MGRRSGVERRHRRHGRHLLPRLTQLLAATRTPPALRVIVPTITSSECYDGWTYQGGAFNLGLALSWATTAALAQVDRRAAAGEDVSEERDRLTAIWTHPMEALERLPLTALPDEIPSLASYGEWLAHPSRDAFWRATAINDNYEQIDVPALHIAGLADCFLKGTLENYVGLRRRAATEHARGTSASSSPRGVTRSPTTSSASSGSAPRRARRRPPSLPARWAGSTASSSRTPPRSSRA